MTAIQNLSRETVDGFLEQLCAELSTAPLKLDGQAEASLTGNYQGRDVEVALALRDERQQLLMMSPVCTSWTGKDAPALFALLLALNLSPDDTAGAAFCVTPGDGAVRLTYSLIGPTVHYDAFRNGFLRLFALSATWQEQFQNNPAIRPR